MRIPSLKQITKSFFFRRILVKATGAIGKPYLLYDVAKKSMEKAGKDTSLKGMASEGIASVGRLVRLVKAFAAGDYRDVSRKNLILTAAGLLYFVSPLDLIPDALPLIGFLDDITVIGFVLSNLGEELSKFEEHESAQTAAAQTDGAGQATHADLTERGVISGDSVASPLDA